VVRDVSFAFVPSSQTFLRMFFNDPFLICRGGARCQILKRILAHEFSVKNSIDFSESGCRDDRGENWLPARPINLTFYGTALSVGAGRHEVHAVFTPTGRKRLSTRKQI